MKHMYRQSGIIFNFDNFATIFILGRRPFNLQIHSSAFPQLGRSLY